MKHFSALSLASLYLTACVGTPHRDSSEISAAEVGVYKLGIETGCTHAGKSKGDPEATVAAFCKCVVTTFDARLTLDEWQKATFYAQQRRDLDEQRVLAPHVAAIGVCKDKR